MGGGSKALKAQGSSTSVSSEVSAPVEAGSTTLSLDEAIRSALQRNYTIRTTQQDSLRAALEVTRTQDAAYLPGVSVNAGYGYTQDLSHSFFLGRDLGLPNASQRLNYNVGADYTVYSGGANSARIRGAQSSLLAAQNTNLWTRDQIVFNVISAYFDALRNRELVFAAQKTLAEAQGQLDRSRGLYQAGTAPIAQVYQQEAVVGQEEVALIQAQNNFENAKADLLFLLDIAPTDYSKYNLSLAGVDTTTSPARRTQVEGLVNESNINRVIDNRPDIVALRNQIDVTEAQIDVTRAGLLPQVGVNLGIGGSGANESITKVRFDNALQGGVSVSMPIFDRNQTSLLVEEQRALLETDRIRLNQQVQSVRSDVAKAQNNLTASERSLDATDRALRSAEESLRLAQERLRVGAGIQLDVVVAQSQLETARTNRVNAVYNFLLAQRQLEYILNLTSY